MKNRNGNKIGLYLVFSKIHNLPTTGLRFFTVYGPWGRPDMSPMLFADAIMNGNTLKVFNNGDMGRDLKNSSSPVRLLDYIETLEDCLGKKAVKDFLPMQPGGTETPSMTQVKRIGYNV